MKKTFRFVSMAVAVLAAASCAKEFVEVAPEDGGNKVTFNLSLTETKTSLEAGKTVWAVGDSILVTDGTNKVKVAIPDSFAGVSEAKIEIDMTNLKSSDLYAVYPPQAFASVSGGKVNVKVSSDQSGNFEEANICVAKASDYVFSMKNATAVLKIRVAEDIETVMISASSADTLAGTVAVTCADAETPLQISATSPGKSIKVTTGGLDGDYYVAVVPGTYSEFSMTALTLTGKTQKKYTTGKSLAINDLADLGVIGDELVGSALEGDGTEDSPFLIKDIADITALASVVNLGQDYYGSYFKVLNNIEGVTAPIGSYDDEEDYYFRGNFDGNGKVITLNMDNAEFSGSCVGLFGEIGEGANIHDVVVNGVVSYPKADMVAGLVGCVNAGAGATISNCINNASVRGTTDVGGIVGYGDASANLKFTITGCSNTGKVSASTQNAGGIAGRLAKNGINMIVSACKNHGEVTAPKQVGGIVGYAYYVKGDALENSGAITSTASAGGWWAYSSGKVSVTYSAGSAGIFGYAQNSSMDGCSNSGLIKGQNKVGGIAGTAYWSNVINSTNTGAVSATSTSQAVVGGIVGWAVTNSSINDCVNDGEVTGYNSVGGIVGAAQATNTTSSSGIFLRRNTNNGSVTATNYAGGMIGYSHPGGTTKTDFNTYVMVYACTNNGAITAHVWAGGMMGYGTFYVTSAYTYMVNCLNTGTITGMRSDKDGGEFAGGIYGGCGAAVWAGPYVVNSINTGEVHYREASHKGVFCGGIAGRQLSGRILNCYNAGTVGIESGTPAAGVETRLGAITGSLEKQTSGSAPQVNYSYYFVDVCSQIIGTSSTLTPGAATASCDVDGSLSQTVTVGDADYSDVVAVLNAYVAKYPTLSAGGKLNTSTWPLYQWTEGPELVIPAQ